MKTLVMAKVVLFREDGKTLILRRSQDMPYRPGELDVAGGKVEDGEDFAAAAIREVQEETGLMIDPAKLHLAFADSGLRNDVPTNWLFFVAMVADGELTISHEHQSAQWMELNEAIAEMEDDRQTRLLEFIRDHQLMN